jgi:uncharacterized protein
MAGYYKLDKSKDNKFFFNLKADNHESVLTSETYNAKQSALDGIASVQKNSQVAEHFKAKVSKKGLHFFDLIAGNNETIGKSEEYASEQGMKDGMAVVKKLGPTKIIKDATE